VTDITILCDKPTGGNLCGMAVKLALIVYQHRSLILRRGEANQAEIGELQRRNHAQRKEGQNHRWIFDRRSDLTRCFPQALQVLRDIFERPVGHDPGDRQRDFSKNFPLARDRVAPPDSRESG